MHYSWHLPIKEWAGRQADRQTKSDLCIDWFQIKTRDCFQRLRRHRRRFFTDMIFIINIFYTRSTTTITTNLDHNERSAGKIRHDALVGGCCCFRHQSNALTLKINIYYPFAAFQNLPLYAIMCLCLCIVPYYIVWKSSRAQICCEWVCWVWGHA